MDRLCAFIFLIAAFTASAWAGVTVSSPSGGAKVGSPVSFVASASTSTCSGGVASMGVYIDDQLTYVVNGTSLNTKLSLDPGKPQNCGAAMGPLRWFELHHHPSHGHHGVGSVCNFAGQQQYGGVAGAVHRNGSDFDLRQGRGLDGNLHRPVA